MAVTARITLDQLRVLVAVAEGGTFSAAARRLGRVQSAVSQSVQLLEQTLRVDLFDRGGKIPHLTEIGRELVEDARGVLRAAEYFGARAASLSDEVEPELRLAVDGIVPGPVLRDSLAAVQKRFPNVSITILVEAVNGAERRLREGQANLGIYVPALSSGVQGLATEFIGSIAVVPVVAAGHPLADEPGPLTRATLSGHTQLMVTEASQTMAAVSGSIFSGSTLAFNDLNMRLDYLLAGFGWCHFPVHSVRDHLMAGRLKRLVLEERGSRFLSADLHVVHEPGRPPRAAGRLLMAELRKRLRADAAISARMLGAQATD